MSESATTTVDTIFKVLSHSYRRHALTALRDHSPRTLEDLARTVTERAHRMPIDRISGDEVTRVFLGLYHTHVPMLVEAGMVEYDESAAIVTVGTGARQAAPFLALADDTAPQVA